MAAFYESAAARALMTAALTAALAACETPASHTPHRAARSPGATATAPAPSAAPPAVPALPAVIWTRGPENPPLAAELAAAPRDPFAAQRSIDGTREGRVMTLPDGAPAAELVDLQLSTNATRLVVRGAEDVGFAGSLFWAFGGLGAVFYDGTTNETRTVPMAGPPVASPDGAHLAFVAGSSVYVVDASHPRDDKELFRGDLTSEFIRLQFAGDSAVVVPGNPARLVRLGEGAPVTLPADATDVEGSPHGRFLAVVGATEAGSVVSLLDANDARVIGRRPLGFGMAARLAWSPDEAHLVAAASPESIWLMRSADGTSSNVAELDAAMLVGALAITAGGEVCVWPRTYSRTSCEGWPVYSIRSGKPLKNDPRSCLASGGVAALVSVDRARYLPLVGDGSGSAECHWVLSADGTRYAGVVTDQSGATRVEVVDVSSRRVLHGEPLDSARGVGLAFFGTTRLEITSTSEGGAQTRRQIEIAPGPARKP